MKHFFVVLFCFILVCFKVNAAQIFECVSPQREDFLLVGLMSSQIDNRIMKVRILDAGTEKIYNKDHLAGFWNIGDDLKLALLEEGTQALEYILKAKRSRLGGEGTSVGHFSNRKGEALSVDCVR